MAAIDAGVTIPNVAAAALQGRIRAVVVTNAVAINIHAACSSEKL
jgi:hypothetical protein